MGEPGLEFFEAKEKDFFVERPVDIPMIFFLSFGGYFYCS